MKLVKRLFPLVRRNNQICGILIYVVSQTDRVWFFTPGFIISANGAGGIHSLCSIGGCG